jgi:hypothetical protein
MKRFRMRTHCVCGHSMREHVLKGLSGIIHPGSGPCIRCDCNRFNGVKASSRVAGSSKYCQGTPPAEYAPSPEPEPIHW